MFKAYTNEPETKDVYFRVAPDKDGNPWLVACTRTGNPIDGGNILWISEDGTIFRCPSVSPELGLKLDDAGRVVLYPGDDPKPKSPTLAEIKQMVKDRRLSDVNAVLRKELGIEQSEAAEFIEAIRR